MEHFKIFPINHLRGISENRLTKHRPFLKKKMTQLTRPKEEHNQKYTMERTTDQFCRLGCRLGAYFAAGGSKKTMLWAIRVNNSS